ncbi:MAG: DCC1-like thiol-disulfide oxidoreductase family protein [Pseudomonadota bacterium]
MPDFTDTGTIAVMDGECVLCMAGARLIDTFDKSATVGICPAQTPLGTALLAHFGMAPDDPETWLVLDGGKAHESLDGIIHLGRRIGGIGWLLQVFRILPRPARDWLYRRIARNRYAFFARRETCTLPTPSLRKRLIEPVPSGA